MDTLGQVEGNTLDSLGPWLRSCLVSPSRLRKEGVGAGGARLWFLSLSYPEPGPQAPIITGAGAIAQYGSRGETSRLSQL